LRVLIDESLPQRIAEELPGHEVSTVRQQQWTGLRNGVLLRSAAAAGFQVFVTADRKLQYQQNIPAIGIAVVVLTGVHNKVENLRPLLPKVLDALSSIQRGTVVEIAG